MKKSSQGSVSACLEEKQKNYGNKAKNADSSHTSLKDIPCGLDSKEKDSEEPNQIFAWFANASKLFAPKFGTTSIEELESMVSLYLSKVSSCISKCYVPNRAAKMKRYMNDMMLFFSFHYREIPEEKKTFSFYLDKMTDLMAYYIDMEIQASSRAKEHPLVIASKLTSSLFIILDKSPDHILDSILKANNMNRNFWELCSLVFSGVLKKMPDRMLSELTYVRYILVYKMWKRVVQGPEERKKVVTLASLKLKHPPNFVEKIRAGLLNGIIPRISKKRSDVTMFLIQAKFDVKEKAKAFLKYVDQCNTSVMFVPTVPAIKTDIPLLVGHLPDFGPAPCLIKLEPPDSEEDERKNVDLTSSRLMNEIWTSVNHEASFREAIRMQNVTTYSRDEAFSMEKKRLQRVLKQRKGKVKNLPKVPDSDEVDKMCDDTIVLSDDDDRRNDDFGKENPVVIPNPKAKTKRGTCIPAQIQKRDPSPPPKVVTPPPKQVILPPPPQTYILTPRQIKQEIIIDDDDDVIEVKQKVEDPTTSEVQEVEAKDEHYSDDGGQSDIDLGTVHASSELKEEQDVDGNTGIQDKDLSIRINRELLDQIKCSKSECGKEQRNVAGTSSSREVPSGSGNSEKTGNALFDDEETSWSPSGGNQEFFRNVVDNFISEYLPGDEENRTANGVDGSQPSSSHSVQGVDGATSERSGSERKTRGRSMRDSHQEEAPSPKRARTEEVVQPKPVPEAVEEQGSSSRVTEQPEEQCALPEFDESLIGGVFHEVTLARDHNLFLSQANFRDALTRIGYAGMEVPSPNQVDPDTGTIVERCYCVQCKSNFDALQANYRALVAFVASRPREEDAESPVPEGSADLDSTDADPEPNPQLPFKKRKAFCGSEERRDDGESQHSDGSKEEADGKNWADEYPQSRMLSIADVEETPSDEYASPPLPSCSYQAPLPAASYQAPLPAASYNLNPSTSAASSSLYSGGTVVECSGLNPAGGGFPPFTAVVPPSTTYAQYYEPQTSARHRQQEEPDERPRFRTPAELKEIVQADTVTPSPSPAHPWTQDLVNVAYFTRKLNNHSSSIATTPDRRNVESTPDRRTTHVETTPERRSSRSRREPSSSSSSSSRKSKSSRKRR